MQFAGAFLGESCRWLVWRISVSRGSAIPPSWIPERSARGCAQAQLL